MVINIKTGIPLLASACAVLPAEADDLTLWYTTPAQVWEEALPIGNGRLVTPVSTSPENAYLLPDGTEASVCEGSTMDQALVRNLFDIPRIHKAAPYSCTARPRTALMSGDTVRRKNQKL